MEDLYDNWWLQAKQIYPDTIPNPKGIKVDIQFNADMQLCELEGEII
jgi:hypothetical protein